MKPTGTRRQFFQTTGLLAVSGIALNIDTKASAAEATSEQPVMIPQRTEVATQDTWDLSSLFSGDDAWQDTLHEVEKRLAEFASFKGQLNGAVALLDCFRLDDAIGLELERLTVYSYLRYSENLADSKAAEMKGLSDTLRNEYAQATSFIQPEMLAIDLQAWNEMIAAPILAPYKLKLDRITVQRPHILLKGEEQILAMLGDVSQTASRAFNLLNNVDLKFGSLQDEKGQMVELSTGSFVLLMNSPDRNVRKKAFHMFYEGYQSHENTLASLLTGSVQKDVFYAMVRKHPSALEGALFDEEIPRSVYDNLIRTVNAALPTLHRYYDLRRRKMGMETIHIYDTYIPILSDIRTDYPWDKGVETICEALSILGDDYVRTVRAGLTSERWSDRYENRGKRSGAFSYGSFSAKPYILMNYKPSVIDGLFTLAHEAGHSMHSYYSAQSQPFAYYDYVTFVAEVASTFNEDMLSRYLLEQATDDRMKAWLINRQIDSIRNTLFRQTMFAQFEQRTHEAVEAKQSLTVKSIRAIYRELLDAYFGPKFVVDNILEVECFRVPHFYRAFYVYKYATGLAASLALAQRVGNGGEQERNDYLSFLRGGSSATPIELLRRAGVDMESPAPIESAMNRFKELVDQLEKIMV